MVCSRHKLRSLCKIKLRFLLSLIKCQIMSFDCCSVHSIGVRSSVLSSQWVPRQTTVPPRSQSRVLCRKFRRGMLQEKVRTVLEIKRTSKIWPFRSDQFNMELNGRWALAAGLVRQHFSLGWPRPSPYQVEFVAVVRPGPGRSVFLSKCLVGIVDGVVVVIVRDSP